MATVVAFHAHPDLAAHKSQVYGGGRSARLQRVLVALPVPVFGLLCGREWFAEPGASTAAPGDDILRPAPPEAGSVRR